MVSIPFCGLVIKSDGLPCPAFRPDDIVGKTSGTVRYLQWCSKKHQGCPTCFHGLDECYGKTQIQNFYRAVV